ncbi:MAG: immunoglobulin domain-containing protein, partial [Candidatus Kapabacteria bacterium]|nr:immunoglobulin domain-containing protein [Candidatus Kapabacteria bacterium]MDW8225416.1 immunoglobulin domain-containing protein [Bacteroidota bacterium]
IVQDVPAVVQVQLGQPLVLEIQASGDELQYQWYKDWQPIAGATSPRYEKSAAEQGDVGTYWCVVQNRCDSAWSRQAQVQVVVSVAEAKERAVLEVVPQPVLGGVMEIRYVVEGEGVIVVRDAAGREVERRLVMGTGRTVVAVSGSGTYTVQIEQAGRVIGQRVVVVVR